jgi:hypothetical protein
VNNGNNEERKKDVDGLDHHGVAKIYREVMATLLRCGAFYTRLFSSQPLLLLPNALEYTPLRYSIKRALQRTIKIP